MAVSYVVLDDAGWSALEGVLNNHQSCPQISTNILSHLRQLNAQSFLIEDRFLNRDFTDAFAFYYAKNFRRHSKHCRRILFFAQTLHFLLETKSSPAEKAVNLAAANPAFLGYIVLRPITRAPLSEAVLKFPPASIGFEGYLLTRAEFKVHVLGAELRLEGMPMTQQDSRIGACAQAAIWSASRFFHARHRGPFLTTVDLTKSALANPDINNNLVLPTGSESLSANTILAALRSVGREVLVYQAQPQRSADIINRYVDSGIPVILVLKFQNQQMMHAVIATGQVITTTFLKPLPSQPTRAESCEAFYVNDDQLGANLRMGVRSKCAISEVPYNLEENLALIIIPLPNKIYLPAEKAENIAWDSLGFYATVWSNYKVSQRSSLGTSEELGDELVYDFYKNKVLVRTYLTHGWKFKERALNMKLPASVQGLAIDLDLPRYVYVSEFSSLSDLDRKSLQDRRISSICVIDATGKHREPEAALFFHAPGYVRRFKHNSRDELVEEVAIIRDDNKYLPRIRGSKSLVN